MVLFREFFTGSIQIIQGGKPVSPVTNNGRVRDVWQGRKGLGQAQLESVSSMIGHQISAASASLSSVCLLAAALGVTSASSSSEIAGSHDFWDVPGHPRVTAQPGSQESHCGAPALGSDLTLLI